MTKQEAQNRIKALQKIAYNALNEAESLADEHDIQFDFTISYGAGATYYPPDQIDEWMRSDLCIEEGQGAWISSSQQC